MSHLVKIPLHAECAKIRVCVKVLLDLINHFNCENDIGTHCRAALYHTLF